MGIAFLLLPLLVLSAFFSASETALFLLDRETLRRFTDSSGRLRRLVATLLDRPRSLLITILFGNLLVNVSFYAIASMNAWRFASAGNRLAAAVLVVSAPVIVIVFGEVTPKALALVIPETVATLAAFPLLVLRTVITPIRIPVSAFSRTITNLLIQPHHHSQPYVTKEELVMLVDLSRQQGLLDEATASLMQQLVDFARIRVHEVMVPRVDLALFDVRRPVVEFLELVGRTRHGRVPIYEDNIDNVIGIVHSKDALLNPARPLRELAKQVLFVPESKTIESLLAEFRRLNESVAMVVDEYGGIAGMVTLEDVTEEIVGEIHDEYDRPVESVVELNENTYSLSGRLCIRDWSELFDVPGPKFQSDRFEVDTLGGFVGGLFGRLPKTGESITFGNLRFTVESMARRRIDRVRLEIIENGQSDHRKGTGGDAP